MIGQTVSHYKVLEKLGEGGMGIVYKAEDTRLKRTVALKFLSPQLTRDPDAKERFLHEAQAAAALEHQNICNIYEIDESGDQVFIVMSCCKGENLKEKIDRGPLKIDEALKIAIQIAEGLQEAHEKGIVHRDIKSANIMIDEKGQVKIMDFGLAKLKGQTKITKAGTTMGTAAYMSPEQAQGANVDHRTDIWSLGVVLYEMISGQFPFKGEYEQAVIYSIMNEEPEPPTALRTGVPMELERIANKSLAKDPSGRYQHADDMVVDLRKLKEESKPGLKTTKKDIGKNSVPRMRRFILSLSFLMAVLVVIGGYFIFKGKEAGKASPPTTSKAVKISVPKWENSVAVLPFHDFSPGKDQEYFCDGMTDSIISRLSRVKKLKIISLTSVLQYKSQTRNIRKIGQELGVNTILEGTIQKEGNKIRINAQLIDVADDSHIWQNTYNRELEAVFAIQDDISQSIVKALKIELLGEKKGEKKGESKDVRGRYYTRSTAAYEFYIQGRFFWRKRTEESLKKAIEFFNKALEKDPGYAPAYAGLADTYYVMAWYRNLPQKEGYSKAEQAALKALEIDDQLAEAYTSLAAVKLEYHWDFAGAKKSFQRAIELNPGYATAHHWYARYFWYTGGFNSAITEMKQALELDPLSPSINRDLGWAYIHARRYDKAIEVMQRTIGMYPDFPGVHLALAIAFLRKSKYDDALNEIKKEYGPSSPKIEYWASIIRARTGNIKELKEYIYKLKKEGEINEWSPAWVAALYAEIGSADQVFTWLGKAIDQRVELTLVMVRFPKFDKFRTDPRYKTLLKKIGLEK
jgi:serine/threonine-protein kinase